MSDRIAVAPATTPPQPIMWYECLTCGFVDELDTVVYHLFEMHDGICLLKPHCCVIRPTIVKRAC